MLKTSRLTLLLACAGLFLQSAEVRRTKPGVEDERAPRQIQAPVVDEETETITDDPTGRRKADREWYGEDWKPSYRKFMIQAAQKEAARYQHLMPRVGKNTEINAMGLGSAAEINAAAAVAGSTWTNIGPTNADSQTNGGTLYVRDSGRAVNIITDPNSPATLYMATAGGGVWKTTNGGTTWAAITETIGSLSCGDLAMDPSNSNTLYLGLGDAFDGTGIGILKTTDGGATWAPAVFLGDSTVINSIVVAPQNSNIVLATTNLGLYRSTDAGATWSLVSVGTLASPYGWTLASAGGNSFVMSLEAAHDATTGTTDGQIWHSQDAGATWTKATGVTKTTGVGRITIASAPSLPTTLYAMAAVPLAASATDLSDIFKSTDGGRTWTATGAVAKNYTNTNAESTKINGILNGQGWYNHMVLVDPTNPNIAYFGGALLAAKTTDGGSTYKQITNWLAQYSLPYVHADFHCGHIAADGTVYFGTDGGIFKSTDAGATFTSNLNIGISSHLIYSVGSSAANRNAVIGGFQDNGTRVRSGATSTFNQPMGGDGFGSLIHPTNASNMLGTLYYSRIYKSTNGGTSFTSASSGITESNNTSTSPFITRITPGLADATGNTVYTFSNAKVYKTTNYATSWTAMGVSGLPTTSVFLRNVGAAKSNASVVGVVMNGGRVYLTANAGSTWTASGTLPNNGSSLSYIWFDTANYNTVYVASVAPDNTKTHLWKSQNFGSSWTAIDGGGFPSGVPVNCIQNDPGDSNTLYAGTHMGVYKSTDAGTSWTRFGTGMPLVNVTDFYLAPDSSMLRASTFGRGFWELNTVAANTVTASISAPSSNVTVASGTAVNFAGSATDSSATATLTYGWTFGDGGTATGASAVHTYSNTGASNAVFTATLKATDNTGANGSATRVITVTPAASAPAITTQPLSQSVNVGQTATFTVAAAGTGPLSYQWRKGGVAITGATAASYTTAATVAGDSGSVYSVVVTNTLGSVTSGNATLTVNTVTPELIVNGTFETGTTPWTGTTAVIGTFAAQPAYAGTRCAAMGGKGVTTTQNLYQTVTIPATATTATLGFYLHIDTTETTKTKVYDKVVAQVLSNTGTVLGTLGTYSNLNKATGYALKSFNLLAYKGQTVRINFLMTEDSSAKSNFVIDNVSLQVQ